MLLSFEINSQSEPTLIRELDEVVLTCDLREQKLAAGDIGTDGPSKCLDAYGELNETVRRYVAALNVFFAPTSLPDQLRKHVEGCVGWNLRNRHPEHKVLYPDDNHIGTRADKTNGMLRISSSEPIRGLDELIPY
jgi:hypothetical protein